MLGQNLSAQTLAVWGPAAPCRRSCLAQQQGPHCTACQGAGQPHLVSAYRVGCMLLLPSAAAASCSILQHPIQDAAVSAAPVLQGRVLWTLAHSGASCGQSCRASQLSSSRPWLLPASWRSSAPAPWSGCGLPSLRCAPVPPAAACACRSTRAAPHTCLLYRMASQTLLQPRTPLQAQSPPQRGMVSQRPQRPPQMPPA